MQSVELAGPADFPGWRKAARELLSRRVRPDQVEWLHAGLSGSLFCAAPAASDFASATSPFTAPRAFLQLATTVALHCDAGKFALLYRLLWRLQREPELLRVTMDSDVARALAMEKAVERDIHKMHAFVRFREIATDDGRHSIAWFEPTHHIVEAAAPFFVRRFPNFSWSILTPERSAHWDTSTLSFGPGARRSDAPAEDAKEDLWRTYYASIFNPARLKVASMQQHMPKKYWRNLPESELIPKLIQEARPRTRAMLDNSPTEADVERRVSSVPAPAEPQVMDESLDAIRAQVELCRNCPLWADATQAVFGEGSPGSKIVFVGEQPGDQEDIAGRPFVGPAGQVLDRALTQAGIDRKSTYVTNAVKHFKFAPRGKRRIHKKPSELEIAACNNWLERELRLLKPECVVALGATAARAVLGRAVTIGQYRGRLIPAGEARTFAAASVLVTVHPSYLLRVPDDERESAYAQFIADLQLLRQFA
jgi:uracil-DNA glycosylase